TGVAFARILKKQRPVQEPGNPPLSCFGHHLFEPLRLLVLFRLAAAHQHHVESDKTPALRTFCDIFDPAIWAEMTPPRAKPLGIDSLPAMPRVADIVVAGDRPLADSKFVHQLSGEAGQKITVSGWLARRSRLPLRLQTQTARFAGRIAAAGRRRRTTSAPARPICLARFAG